MFHFSIDRGGTFTDIFAQCPDGSQRTLKLLSVDKEQYRDAPREGIRRILEAYTGGTYPREQPVPASQIASIRMGTTVATNALLERKGHRVALLITKGFSDLLEIGSQARPDIFDLKIDRPQVLYETVVEVDERVILVQPSCSLDPENKWPVVRGEGGGRELKVMRPLNEGDLAEQLRRLKSSGIESLAVALVHSYLWPVHEKRCEEIARALGFQSISLSSDVMPMQRLVPRGDTATVDAYLSPLIREYVAQFTQGFDARIKDTNIFFMQSDGGLVPADAFIGCRAVLSGPAGGLVGFARTTHKRYTEKAVIGFDMGGTSTDVSRYAGAFERVFETSTAGVSIQAPQLDIHTVAAGGGSRLFYRAGMFVVGPESAGADPGPACYRKGGPLTVTDANLILGRLLPEYFPKIFGPHQNELLNREATRKLFEELASEINASQDKVIPIQDVALGFTEVANETMARAIRNITEGKGYDPAKHVLACFGGAGGQHACSIARILGMDTVYIHKYAGILSAYGIVLADVVHDTQKPCGRELTWEGMPELLESVFGELQIECFQVLQQQGFKADDIVLERFLNLRYKGTDFSMMVPGGDFKGAFLERYHREFGFTVPDGVIVVDDIRVRANAALFKPKDSPVGKRLSNSPALSPRSTTETYFGNASSGGNFYTTAVFELEDLLAEDVVEGPAIIIDPLATTLVEPGCRATLTEFGDVCVSIGKPPPVAGKDPVLEMNPVQLAIFGHRFMGIAEQMGRILRRTALSTNIKERLDFSCALFGPDGGLVSNAPHIPVHLGAMQETIQYQIKTRDQFKPGEVILSNHPVAGGSHLPDLTVITPCFSEATDVPLFYVASRGHHADIGGLTPGSMPPHSRSLEEEGATFLSFELVKDGVFQEESVTKVFKEAGGRNIRDNLADLKAQVSANHRGIALVQGLLREYGEEMVLAYMGFIQKSAELAVQDLLRRVAKRTGNRMLQAEDQMDDGSVIRLQVSIEKAEGTAVVDFTGTDPQVLGNWNAPFSITTSALIYSLRSMVSESIPLNQGCLTPVTLVVPRGSILHPRPDAAVVGGNVLTSQRVVDVILRAFRACAASQGCMNNVTFGDETSGYYETVAGGSGAGPGWKGVSGVHTHMTNTRITDVEVLEERYPVMLNRFCLRLGSGGAGKYSGGNGVVRELVFRRPQVLSVLSERRVFPPWGAEGGGNAQRGRNTLIRARDGERISLGSKAAVNVGPGDLFLLETPGGGGWGKAE